MLRTACQSQCKRFWMLLKSPFKVHDDGHYTCCRPKAQDRSVSSQNFVTQGTISSFNSSSNTVASPSGKRSASG